jgi:putative membrane protein
MVMTKNRFVGFLVLACFFALPLSFHAAVDTEFAIKAAKAGKMEVELGNLAARKGQSASVRSFGRRMVSDHTRAGKKLKAIARSIGISLPEALDAEQQAEIDRLSQLNGAEFDRAYMEKMVADHEMAVSDFETEASSGTNSKLKVFATATLPILRMHLRMAKQTAARVK